MYEMIGKAQPEMELLEGVAFIYPLFTKSRQFTPICNQNLTIQHSFIGFYE